MAWAARGQGGAPAVVIRPDHRIAPAPAGVSPPAVPLPVSKTWRSLRYCGVKSSAPALARGSAARPRSTDAAAPGMDPYGLYGCWRAVGVGGGACGGGRSRAAGLEVGQGAGVAEAAVAGGVRGVAGMFVGLVRQWHGASFAPRPCTFGRPPRPLEAPQNTCPLLGATVEAVAVGQSSEDEDSASGRVRSGGVLGAGRRACAERVGQLTGERILQRSGAHRQACRKQVGVALTLLHTFPEPSCPQCRLHSTLDQDQDSNSFDSN